MTYFSEEFPSVTMEKAKKIDHIHIKDLAKLKVCEGELFFSTRDGKKFLLKGAGAWIDQAFVKKHATYQTNFEYHLVTNSKYQENLKELFQELKYSQFEKDLRDKSHSIINKFIELGESKSHLLDFALVCFNEFNESPDEVLEKIYETDESLFKKSFYSASLSVITAISNGFFSYAILKDFYNVTFFLDFGLCEKPYSYFLAQACNFESKIPGSGLKWLEKSGASATEIELFKNHPYKSYELIGSNIELAYPEFKEIILYQHELSNGLGFPRGIRKHQVLSWESVVILASTLLEIGDENSTEDIFLCLQNFSESNVCELPVKKTYQRLLASLKLDFNQKLGSLG